MIRYHKPILFFFLLALLSVLISFKEGDPNQRTAKWVLIKGGTLQVKGSTNINNFSCSIIGYSNPDTILVSRSRADKESVALTGALALDVKLFDCRNPVMTGDLRKTLKSKDHPKLKIKFISLSKFPDFSSPNDVIKGFVEIELAGVSRRFDVNYTFYRDEQKIIRLVGERDVNFSDFNLTPPRKLGGMIQTDNKLSVKFQLGMKSL